MNVFLGHPYSYWIEIERGIQEKGTGELIQEVANLRAKVSFYESRIKQLAEFTAVNLEVGTMKIT